MRPTRIESQRSAELQDTSTRSASSAPEILREDNCFSLSHSLKTIYSSTTLSPDERVASTLRANHWIHGRCSSLAAKYHLGRGRCCRLSRICFQPGSSKFGEKRQRRDLSRRDFRKLESAFDRGVGCHRSRCGPVREKTPGNDRVHVVSNGGRACSPAGRIFEDRGRDLTTIGAPGFTSFPRVPRRGVHCAMSILSKARPRVAGDC